jgi:5-methylcytosine-specific restriction endonuclease McrBC regulatory subunit McrC
MKTTDNNGGKSVSGLDGNKSDAENLHKISRIKLEEQPDLLVFPPRIQAIQDESYKNYIFSYSDRDNDDFGFIETGNIMGFIGLNDTRLTISSRFEKNDKDFFLHYMLQKVCNINIVNFDQSPDCENIHDFLLYFFPVYLNRAMSQGLFKQYKRNAYNDAKIRGVIDVKRHIHTNIPFSGRIAYNAGEYSYDNTVTQLIRHTIEFIKNHKYSNGILFLDSDTVDNVNRIILATASYNKNDRKKIINYNRKQINHPYFHKYRILQKLCLCILRFDRITYGKKDDRIYGLLFDGAWLWEEYLNTILKRKFIHPENKTGKLKLNLLEKENRQFQPIYPDFISKDKKYVADAKYMNLMNGDIKNQERALSIYYKTIAYMYRLNSVKGFLFFPFSNGDGNEPWADTYNIIDTEGKLVKIGLNIPSGSSDMRDFRNGIQHSEKKFLEKIESEMR